MVDEQDSSIFKVVSSGRSLIYQLHDSASDRNVRRQLFCLHGHCDRHFRDTPYPHSNTVTRSCHVVWGGAFSAPRICKTNILRHIHPRAIYPCKDKINQINTSKLNYCHYASIRKAKRILVFKQSIAAYCCEN
jgi:hypothetical protein